MSLGRNHLSLNLQRSCWALLLLAVLVAATPAGAATLTWSAAASGNWSSAANWTVTSGTDADGVPDADDIVVFDATSSAGAAIDAAFSVQRLQVGAGYGGTINLGANTLSVASEFTVAGAGSFDAGTGLLRFTGSMTVRPSTLKSYS